MSAFDPNSENAMFAKIMAKLEEHDEKFDEILKNDEEIEGRVRSLEEEKWTRHGASGIISVAVAAFVAWVQRLGG